MLEHASSGRGGPSAEAAARPLAVGDWVDIVGGNFRGQQGCVAHIAEKVKVKLDSGGLADVFPKSLQLREGDPGAAAVQGYASSLASGVVVDIISGNYSGRKGVVVKPTGQKVEIHLVTGPEPGKRVSIMQTSVRPAADQDSCSAAVAAAASALPADGKTGGHSSGPVASQSGQAGSSPAAGPWAVGDEVDITGGNYGGCRGRVINVPTGEKITLELTTGEAMGKQVCIKQTSLTVPAGTSGSRARGSSAQSTGPAVRLLPNAPVRINTGNHSGALGKVARVTDKMVHVDLESGKSVCVQQTSVTFLGDDPPGAPAFQLLTGNDEGGLPSSSTGEAPLAQPAIKKITLQAPHEKDEDCFLKRYFASRVLQVEQAVTSSTRCPSGLKSSYTHDRQEYHLLSSKLVDDGQEFWGSKKQALRMMCVARGERSLQDELEDLADFASIHLARKVASRLELLQSPGMVYKSSDELFEMIPEPQPTKESGGCGFIPQHLLYDLMHGRKTAGPISSIQVRVFGARLGVLKGMLTVRRGLGQICGAVAKKRVSAFSA